MQKIMFEHRLFGLEQAVIARLKENTRRRVRFPKGINDKDVESAVMGIDQKGRVYFTFSIGKETFDVYPKYQIGERVAVAQSYKDVINAEPDNDYGNYFVKQFRYTPGWTNKMYVAPGLMPHVIEITDIKAERLQDISDDDCLREGIIPVTWRQHPEPFSDHYVDHDLWTLEKYREQFEDAWGDDDPEAWAATSPKTAFAVLIRKLQGKKAWERNEWQFAYTFKLIK